MLAESLILDLNDEEPVPAFFLKPATGDEPRPVVLYSHSRGDDYLRGNNEVLSGVEYLQPEPFRPALVKAGFSVLCYDACCFGDRWHLSLNGLADELPSAAGFPEADGLVAAAYEALGHPQAVADGNRPFGTLRDGRDARRPPRVPREESPATLRRLFEGPPRRQTPPFSPPPALPSRM